jgi:large subunit ribosomal protein L30
MAKKVQPQPEKMLSITLVKSAIGFSVRHKATVRALGFHRLHQTVVHKDTPALRGMLSLVNHLVVIEEQVAK